MANTVNKSFWRRSLTFLSIVLLVIAGLAINRVVQSYFGEQARQQILLNPLPYSAALAKAEANNQLVLVELSAVWCPTCRKLDQTVFNQERVKQMINDNFTFARVDYDSAQGPEFMQRYQVTGYPVLLIVNSQGDKLARLPLTFDPSEFIGNLNQTLATYASTQGSQS